MSKARHETIADIVAEMRLGVKDWKGERLGVFDCFADRIEAAHEREVAELRECLKETVVIASAEYHNNSCFKHVKCGEIERCKTCKVVRWRKALQDEGGAK